MSESKQLTERERHYLCDLPECIEHGVGTVGCPVPKKRGEVEEWLEDRENHSVKELDVLEKQPTPSETKCPFCGAEPTEQSQAEHKLSKIGYKHDDVALECRECGEEWTCGVPIGEFDGGDDLYCQSCEARFMRCHRVEWEHPKLDDDEIFLHLKCPNCYWFNKVKRESDNGTKVLIGYPDITGSTDDARPHGYIEGEEPGKSGD